MPNNSESFSTLDRAKAVPLHQQLACVLRTRIRTGQFTPGSQLPGEQQLIHAYQVSQPTVRQALGTLVQEGLLVRQRGRGTFVSRSGATQQQSGRHLSHAITVLMPFAESSLFASLLASVEGVFRSSGFRLMLANNDDDPDIESACLRDLAAHEHDGLLWMIPKVGPNPATLRLLRQKETRMVMIDRRPLGEDVDFVASDHFSGAMQAVNHLADVGCRRIAFFGDPGAVSTHIERLGGYRQALELRGIGYDPALVIKSHKWFRQGGADCAHKLLRAADRKVDGVFCITLSTVLGAIEVFRQAGVKVPDDIALVGCDDEPRASASDPPITVIRQDINTIGRTAAELLVRRIMSVQPGAVEDLRIPTQLIVRESTQRRRITEFQERRKTGIRN